MTLPDLTDPANARAFRSWVLEAAELPEMYVHSCKLHVYTSDDLPGVTLVQIRAQLRTGERVEELRPLWTDTRPLTLDRPVCGERGFVVVWGRAAHHLAKTCGLPLWDDGASEIADTSVPLNPLTTPVSEWLWVRVPLKVVDV